MVYICKRSNMDTEYWVMSDFRIGGVFLVISKIIV